MPDPSLSTSELLRFDRQIALPQIDIDGQLQLKQAKVLIVGAGGLGCAVAQALASMGIGEFVLMDGDTVCESNLPRQMLYSDADIGKPKVIAAQQALANRNPNLQITAIAENFTPEAAKNILLDSKLPSLVIDCTDNSAARQHINQIYKPRRVTCVFGSAIRFEGSIFVSHNEENTPCYNCLSKVWPDPQESCVERGIFTPVVTIVGYYQALIAGQILLGVYRLPPSTLLFFDALQHQWQSLQITLDTNCEVCQKNQ